MAVECVLFAHWPVDPDQLRPYVPDQLELDVRDGRAWVSILPFTLADVRPRPLPKAFGRSTPEVNLRTYVRYRDEPGLYFFSIDLGWRRIAAVTRRLTRLPCYGLDADVETDGGRTTVRSVRTDGPPAGFAATYAPTGTASRPEPGSLDEWLVERYRFYAPRGAGVLFGAIDHDPWPLQPATATIHENDLLAAAGLPEPDGEPRVRHCDRLKMTGSVPRRLGTVG